MNPICTARLLYFISIGINKNLILLLLLFQRQVLFILPFFPRCLILPQPNRRLSFQTHGTEKLMMKPPALAHVLPQREPAPCRAPRAPRPQAQGSPHRGPSLDRLEPSHQELGPNRPALWAAPLVLGLDRRPQAAGALLAVKEWSGVRTAMLGSRSWKDKLWNCSFPDPTPAR